MEQGLFIKKLIFFVQWPVTTYEEKAWHFDFLRRQGFSVEVLDLTPLLNSSIVSRIPVVNEIQGDFIHRLSSYADLEEFLACRVNGSVFIDYLANHSNVTFKTEKIYRLFKKYQVRYFVISSGALPVLTFEKSLGGLFDRYFFKIKKIFNLKKLSNYICEKIILFLTRRNIFYPVPIRIFSGGSSEVMRFFIGNRKIEQETVVPINSYDYDSYLVGKKLTMNELKPDEKFCVFLDEAMTDHPDFGFLGIQYISANEYFESMNRLFDFVEEKMGLRVVIAAHPRSNYESKIGVFKTRTIIKRKTAALVAKSELVIMHMSTSVSFAIIGHKPVVVVKTEGMHINSYLDKLVDNMAITLGTQSINVDQVELSVELFNVKINNEKYNSYLYKYIKSLNADDLPVWEIVLREIKKLGAINYQIKE